MRLSVVMLHLLSNSNHTNIYRYIQIRIKVHAFPVSSIISRPKVFETIQTCMTDLAKKKKTLSVQAQFG